MDKIEDKDWPAFVEEKFREADLAEVPEIRQEPGVLTNMQIAQIYRDEPDKLVALLQKFRGGETEEETRRATYSTVADLWASSKINKQI